jgi:hypothetical protein
MERNATLKVIPTKEISFHTYRLQAVVLLPPSTTIGPDRFQSAKTRGTRLPANKQNSNKRPELLECEKRESPGENQEAWPRQLRNYENRISGRRKKHKRKLIST